ncbi:hypothetical protein [Paenibacillus arenilitoris]|uniref:Uncharacterized protein n=1 Tax=Paenibacillus arenilitoris TaxID=2772299 RepID=A0A927H690_9BACL|nr:hypothetical protein [Paenibacillus arenilitoris]MBD2869735.1 hypothetical protein [Paenibacillus arenilitoris]
MSTEKKTILLIFLYLAFIVIGGRLLFIIPNNNYLGILNADNFFILSCIIILLMMLPVYLLLKTNIFKKTLINFTLTIAVFVLVAVFYYSNLPMYTYEEAGKVVEDAENKEGRNAQVFIPEQREDKIAFGSGPYFKTTNDKYFIYLKNGDEIFIFRFDPLNGEYDAYNGSRKLLE